MSELASGCAHCSKCTDNCVFLQKYALDLAGLETSPQIARECMLCGKYTEVCPKGIEGAALVLNLREKRKTISLRHLPMVLTLKSHLFRSYYSDPTTSVLFPGCNLPAFFPRTMEALDRLARDAGMGVAYDCCGKPLSDLGRSDDALGIVENVAVNLERLDAAELVCACPNCYVFLKSRLRLPVITIYEKLAQWGIKGLTVPQGSLFLPCPDCNERLFLRQIAALLPLEKLTTIENVQCCGLGGGSAAFNGDTRRKLTETLRAQLRGRLHTYCASCAFSWRRQGIRNVQHLLSAVLDIDEPPDVGHGIKNRLRFKNK